MTDPRQGMVPVQTAVVLDTLVTAMFNEVEQREADDPSAPAAAVLEDTEQQLARADEIALDRALRRAGYLARCVEVDFFEPARRPADWLGDLVMERFAISPSWPAAVAATCGDLARAEPLGRPSPDDPNAMSWRVPGPGGHVRHYLARRTIEERLRARERPVEGDPAELKRPWLYGFFVRACEEALPDGAVLDEEPES